MKKNLMTIILIALTCVNITLSAVLVFAVVPSSVQTKNLIKQVAQILDLELESKVDPNSIAVEDIDVYNIQDKLTINLAKTSSDTKNHYVLLSVSLSLNKKHEGYEKFKETIAAHETVIKEYITDEFSKYNIQNVQESKDKIKQAILQDLSDYFKSNVIVNVSFGNMIAE